jgi:mono/diheme cytochrome c family protein
MSVKRSLLKFSLPVLLGAAVALLATVPACTYSHGDPAPACNASTQTITYAGVVSPIFDAHCRECHGSSVAASLAGGYDFGTYQTLNNYLLARSTRLLGCIKQAPGYPAMPQGKPKLSDCDIERIERWIAAGHPQ